MVRAAEAIGKHFEFVRVDMYTNEEQFFVGEITHNQGASVQRFFPPEAEGKLSQILFGVRDGASEG
ncbi:MAG: ATP-grasp fold amidoligase family protein [Minwuia sp.]|nr:ATP-grasp fold amidoligase family protein [Minwuia sp.]